ncbi:hypothetical protein DXG03_006684 [Asterophora parasitica]|uniref:Uncharacterized protein n=1 Tax=Asterophora parasitica TaxID=117018 RepID=A0A9P7FZ13_9AGAR|nr:hypothetical protein DXG03_006684 [Asterophora parasitica]
MKVGGNASATDFFTKHGGSLLLSDSDTKKKYSSRVAELYKEELAKRVRDDAARFPNGIVVDGMESAATPAAKEETEDDFFDSWSKPNTPKTSAPGTPRVATPNIIGRSLSASSSTSAGTASTDAPRTTTSAAAARPARLGAATSRLNSASSASSSTSSLPKKTKLGLGASKAKPVNFAEAERKALEEAERIKQLGYDRQREEAEEKARKEAEALKKQTEIGLKATLTASSNGGATPASGAPSKSAAFPRLGFGAIPGAGAAAAVAAANVSRSTSSPVADNSPTTARDKFGSQKAISSDMYFERNAYDPNAVSEAQSRLQNFRGATAISSNQYFGREEEEELAGHPMGQDSGSLAQFESAAKDAIAKVLANPDVQNVGESIRSGALKRHQCPSSVRVAFKSESRKNRGAVSCLERNFVWPDHDGDIYAIYPGKPGPLFTASAFNPRGDESQYMSTDGLRDGHAHMLISHLVGPDDLDALTVPSIDGASLPDDEEHSFAEEADPKDAGYGYACTDDDGEEPEVSTHSDKGYSGSEPRVFVGHIEDVTLRGYYRPASEPGFMETYEGHKVQVHEQLRERLDTR